MDLLFTPAKLGTCELKNRIAAQIVVGKDRNGGSTVRIRTA